MQKNITVLGIETSCDETSCAIYNHNNGLISNEIYSQIDIHKEFGGVIPELASRDHIKKILTVLGDSLTKSNKKLINMDCIAYTKGPGLIGSLLVGAAIAKSIGYSLKIPTIGINHLEGHILSPLLEKNKPNFPFICLLISGGHTFLVYVRKLHDYEIIGETLDDACGEAFDKVGKLLGFNYPAGPMIEQFSKLAMIKKYKFPIPMIKNKTLNFSFSGIKTHAYNTIKKIKNISNQERAEISYALQDSITKSLLNKCMIAQKKYNVNEIVIVGGVSANTYIRNRFRDIFSKIKCNVYFPSINLCGDNAAMIAYTGYRYFLAGKNIENNYGININPKLVI